MEGGTEVSPQRSMRKVGQRQGPSRDEGLGVYLFMGDPLPQGLMDPAAGAWLGVAWGSLSAAGLSRSPWVVPSSDAISLLVGPRVHTPAAGAVPSMEPRACGSETVVASRRIPCTHFSETRVDGLRVPVTFAATSGAVLTLSVSSSAPSASVVVSPASSLGRALLATEPLGSHTQTSSVVSDTPPIAEAGLSGIGTVAQTEAAPWLSVPRAPAPVVPRVCLPSAVVPGVPATPAHPVPCLSMVWVAPGVRPLATGDAVPKDPVTSSVAAGVAVGMEPEGPANGRGTPHGKATPATRRSHQRAPGLTCSLRGTRPHEATAFAQYMG